MVLVNMFMIFAFCFLFSLSGVCSEFVDFQKCNQLPSQLSDTILTRYSTSILASFDKQYDKQLYSGFFRQNMPRKELVVLQIGQCASQFYRNLKDTRVKHLHTTSKFTSREKLEYLAEVADGQVLVSLNIPEIQEPSFILSALRISQSFEPNQMDIGSCKSTNQRDKNQGNCIVNDYLLNYTWIARPNYLRVKEKEIELVSTKPVSIVFVFIRHETDLRQAYLQASERSDEHYRHIIIPCEDIFKQGYTFSPILKRLCTVKPSSTVS